MGVGWFGEALEESSQPVLLVMQMEGISRGMFQCYIEISNTIVIT